MWGKKKNLHLKKKKKKMLYVRTDFFNCIDLWKTNP